MAPVYGWGSTASRLEPLWGWGLLYNAKFPEIPDTAFCEYWTSIEIKIRAICFKRVWN